MRKGPPYGVLLVAGLRTHQENYALAFAEDPRCQLIAVTDEADVPPPRAAWNREFAAQLGLPYIPDLNEALARDDVHIVSVCAEHERRGRVAVRCAQSGKHLYLDKPIAPSVADADAIVSAVAQAGVRSQMFSFIHAPWAQTAKQVVESGELGELVAVHCDVLFAKGHAGTAPLRTPRKQDPHPRHFTFVDSKHELCTTGVYSLAMVRWLTGCEVRSVFGVTANYFFAEHVRNDVEDFGLLALTLDRGITATISSGRIGWMSHPQGGPCRVHLIGREGALKVDAHAPRVEVYADEPAWSAPPVHPKDPMGFWRSTQAESGVQPKQVWVPLQLASQSDASCFVDCVESGRESEMAAKDGAALVETLMAGYVSAASGEVVNLPLPHRNRFHFPSRDSSTSF